ncbi:precorrin-6y C5,15-methyltransferase (decarboxylating) subunit CbiE [Oculatella sp. LEGE 06141]|uniref:precorrin-6y C5,15-methyltransferase (decarboxylating) subunit CbiE n=1 Tax=Oculatella sp. LEGE 06141 TaxID=1828648 RepID=UPI0018815656|nr:precorrin-6y C5,15-methyltransferase (decarboxylating) subunit CbiE [Oculatella sp. LEGE 06141]MBE9181192.1 precorrin-6y C5,15-methyltransferase (decarboxylating) subunit CbiE [Oculatella sp. LEGE 06141]
MTPVQVVGIGLDGSAGLAASVRQMVEQATVLVGSVRHLNYFPDHPAVRLTVNDIHHAMQAIRQTLALEADPRIVVLASGDPLFFGLGRLLLAELPPDQLTFHPHLSAVQLAFSRVKLPWQDARLISAHGRSLDELTRALQQGAAKIAVLTDGKNTPAAIAHLLLALELPSHYQLWVCENLGGQEERVQPFVATDLVNRTFDPLNVVLLCRSDMAQPLELAHLPAFGLPDGCFLSFSDRPGLMTKREVRILVLGELALQPHQTIWDIGAGTGSVSIEIARLFPSSRLYAIEQTAAGTALIEQNKERFQVEHVNAINGTAPAALMDLPAPDRIFIGGSGGHLAQLLEVCGSRLAVNGVIVLALATLEHLSIVMNWLTQQSTAADAWQHRWLQVQLSRSVPVGTLTRYTPLNPVTLLTIAKSLHR